jgi:hypothetical protein
MTLKKTLKNFYALLISLRKPSFKETALRESSPIKRHFFFSAALWMAFCLSSLITQGFFVQNAHAYVPPRFTMLEKIVQPKEELTKLRVFSSIEFLDPDSLEIQEKVRELYTFQRNATNWAGMSQVFPSKKLENNAQAFFLRIWDYGDAKGQVWNSQNPKMERARGTLAPGFFLLEANSKRLRNQFERIGVKVRKESELLDVKAVVQELYRKKDEENKRASSQKDSEEMSAREKAEERRKEALIAQIKSRLEVVEGENPLETKEDKKTDKIDTPGEVLDQIVSRRAGLAQGLPQRFYIQEDYELTPFEDKVAIFLPVEGENALKDPKEANGIWLEQGSFRPLKIKTDAYDVRFFDYGSFGPGFQYPRMIIARYKDEFIARIKMERLDLSPEFKSDRPERLSPTAKIKLRENPLSNSRTKNLRDLLWILR